MVIGLTGGIGSGKTTVLNIFKQFKNVTTYMADVEAKKLMNSSTEIKDSLIKNFGKDCFKDNQLNRSFLANIVFKDKQKLAILNSIVHPVVHKHLSDFIKNNADKDYIIYENAILFENGSDSFCDKIITVTAPKDIRIQRVVERDNINKAEVENRINNQFSESKKTLQSHYVINNLDLNTTEDLVLQIHKNLTKFIK